MSKHVGTLGPVAYRLSCGHIVDANALRHIPMQNSRIANGMDCPDGEGHMFIVEVINEMQPEDAGENLLRLQRLVDRILPKPNTSLCMYRSNTSDKVGKMTVFRCVPVCKPCRDADVCERAMTPTEAESLTDGKHRRLYPVDLIKLPCGCRDVPWPLMHVLGENFDTIWCEKHGDQKLTKAYIKKAMDEAKHYMARELIGKQSTLFPDEPPY